MSSIRANAIVPLEQLQVLQTRKKARGVMNHKYITNDNSKVIERNFKNRDARKDHSSTYNPDQMPPIFENALLHLKATLVGPERQIDFGENDISNLDDDKFCMCCARKTDRIKLPMNCDLKELAYLGSGYPLYFGYIKFCAVMLGVILLISGFFNGFTNFHYGESCLENVTDPLSQCDKNFITQFSLGNKITKSELIEYQNYLNIASIFVIIIILQFFRRYIQLVEHDCDVLDISATDYTIWITDIPLKFSAFNNDYDEDLQKFLEEEVFQGDPKYRLANVNLTYNLDEVNEYVKVKEGLIKKKGDMLWHAHKEGYFEPGQTPGIINSNIQEIQKKIDTNLNKFYDGKGTEFMSKYFTGQAFVSFMDSEAKELVVQKYGDRSIFNRKPIIKYQGKEIKIQSAPDPLDVFWPNLHVKSQNLRKMFSYFIIALIGTMAYFAIYYYRKEFDEQVFDLIGDNSFLKFFSAFIISVIMNGFNMLILIFGKKLSRFEKNHTKTNFNTSAMKKIAMGQCFVTAMVVYIQDMIQKLENSNRYGQTFKDRGLAYNSVIIIIGNTIIPFLIECFDMKSVFRRYKQWKATSAHKNNTPILMTQDNLNKTMEKMDFDIIYRYSIVIKTMYICAFYADVIPIALLLGLLSLLVTYWIDKYNLLRRRSVVCNMSSDLAHDMVDILEYCLILFALGNLSSHVFLIDDIGSSFTEIINSFPMYGVMIALLHAFLPTKIISSKIFNHLDQVFNEDDYKKANMLFVTDYQRENPATSEASKQQHMKRVMELKKKKQDELLYDNYGIIKQDVTPGIPSSSSNKRRSSKQVTWSQMSKSGNQTGAESLMHTEEKEFSSEKIPSVKNLDP